MSCLVSFGVVLCPGMSSCRERTVSEDDLQESEVPAVGVSRIARESSRSQDSRVKIGVILPAAQVDGYGVTPDWRTVHSFAQAAESHGLDSVWMFDHFFDRCVHGRSRCQRLGRSSPRLRR